MRQNVYEELVAYIVDNQNKFYRLAFSYVKNQEDALDVVQNAVCRALEKTDTLRNRAAIKTWFYKILVNESLQVLRAKKRVVLSEEKQRLEPCYEEKAFEVYDDLYQQMERLESDVQTIIRLRYFEELSLDEIAQIMEMKLNTVKTKLYRGLQALKIIVREEEL